MVSKLKNFVFIKGTIKVKRYLDSLGRYGNSPFLYPLYGNGEMTQCFCRLCAVFGGLYFLRFPLAGLTIDSTTNQCSGIVSTTGERFRAKDAVICNNSYMESISTHKNVIHRTILITNTSIKPSEKEEVELSLF
jgi:RAB protein geranylgeranyltransferase component A